MYAISSENLLLDECKKLNEQLMNLRSELDETKSQVLVAEYKRETDIQSQDRKAQEEIASLQHLVHGKERHTHFHHFHYKLYNTSFFTFIETVEESSFLKSEIDRLASENDRLRTEVTSSHSQSSHSPQVCAQLLMFPSFLSLLSSVVYSLIFWSLY